MTFYLANVNNKMLKNKYLILKQVILPVLILKKHISAMLVLLFVIIFRKTLSGFFTTPHLK